MARIRTIKPEFWDSPSVAKASPWARLLFVAMWNWADDYGRGTANLKELEGFAFPHDDRFTDSSGNTVHFRSLVAEVQACFGVLFYEVDKRPYFAIPTWDAHQRNERRSKQSKHPDPPVIPGNPDDVAEIPHMSAETPNISGAGTGEQGNRGTEEQGNRNPPNPPEGERAKRGGRIPADWEPSPELIAQMRHEAPLVDLRAEHLVFVDYWIAQPGQRGVKLDWEATWRNWMRRKQSDRVAGKLTPTERAAQTATAGRQVAGRQITSLDPKEVTT